MSEDFGAFITSRRRELELTLGDVATQLDVSPITVSNWSNGQATPDADQLDALAALLEVPADELSKKAGVPADTPEAPEPADEPDLVTEPEIEMAETEEPVAEAEIPAATSEIDTELAEMIEEASAEVGIPEVEVPDAEVPAFVEAEVATAVETPEPAPESPPPTTPRRARPAAATATAERPVSTLPLTYIEDPKALMRYRIRWGITLAALVVMFFILLWAAGGLISALSEIKESVTPGGGS